MTLRLSLVLILAWIIPIAHALGGESELNWKVTGLVKADWTGASAASASFGRVNLVAPTEASLQTGPSDGVFAQQWNVGQSRFGAEASWLSLIAKGELDFIDFDQASATTTIRPRLRVMMLSHEFSDHHRLEIGQNWDLFAPPKPFTYNFVGLLFRSGNAGFMRPQLAWKWQQEKIELGFSVGLPAINSVASQTSVERSVLPYFCLATTLKAANQALIFKTAFTQRRIEDAIGNATVFPVYAVSVATDLTLKQILNVRSHLFWGRNFQSTGAALTLGQASLFQEQPEWGGFISAQVKFIENHALQASVGTDRVFGGEGATNGTLVENTSLRAAYSVQFVKSVEAFVEWTWFRSGYASSGSVSRTESHLGELGIVYRI